MECHYCGLKIWGFDALQDEDGLVVEQEKEPELCAIIYRFEMESASSMIECRALR